MDSCTLFEEDEVYVHNAGKGYKFGIVLENSEYVSSDEEDGQDKQDDRLQKGSIRVAWHPSGKETVVPENKVKLVDRSLMPGDVVRRHVPGKDTQCGFIMDMDVLAHIRILRTNKYIYNVDSRDLQPIQKFESGQEVIFDLWWGKVENVLTDVDLVFPDGARCRVDEGDIAGVFEDATEKQRHGEFSMCVYYPGQELRGSIDALCDAKWLHSTPRYCHKVANRIGKTQVVNASIEKIEARSVEVHWVFGGSNGKETVTTPPPRHIDGDNLKKLKVLDWFVNCSLQIGDRELYHIKNDDVIGTTDPAKSFNPQSTKIKALEVPMDEATPEEQPQNNEVNATGQNSVEQLAEDAEYEDCSDSADSDAESEKASCKFNSRKKKNKGFKPGAHRFKASWPSNKPVSKKPKKERIVKPDTTVEVEAEFTTSWAKVMWQDGSVESDIPSVDLFPVHHLDELEFFPGDFVLPNHDVPLPEPADYGVISKADHAERTCSVNWFKVYDAGKATNDSKPILLMADCEMSVYDLKDHPDYKFRPGLSVVPVGGLNDVTPEVSNKGQESNEATNKSEDNPQNGSCESSKKSVNVAKGKNSACQTVGQIFELNPSGFLIVKWADGSISQRYPQEVFVVSDEADEDTDNDEWDSESDYESNASSEASWETESEHEVDADEEIRDKDDSGCDHGNLKEHKTEIDSLLSRAESALNRLQKVINDFDGSIAVPDCFHDIIRIYRSCHELDKILKSSFFSDPELQQLISQAKAELKKDKNNKISRHLTQLFETWSRSVPNSATSGRTFGLVGADGKTRTYGNVSKIVDSLEVMNEMPSKVISNDEQKENLALNVSEGAAGENPTEDKEASAAEVLETLISTDTGVLRKEISAPTISNSDLSEGAVGRRPSDPLEESLNRYQKFKEANLVGENCVAKASKRTKSDGFEDCEREAKKSRDDCKTPNQDAQELCFKICKCLQKQILLIHEEMNKRTNRLFSAIDKESSRLISAIDKESNNESEEKLTLEDKTNATTDNVNDTAAETASSNCDNVTNAFVIPDNHVAKPDDVSLQCTDDLKENNSKESSPQTSLEKSFEVDSKQSEDITVEEKKAETPDVDEEPTSPLIDDVPCKGFEMVSEVPESHAFFKKPSQPTNMKAFRNAVKKELKLFHTSLPDGIFVLGFENRLDLFSVMILGPEGTPYEDAVFLFDFYLPNDYPVSPPVCHYHSHCSDRLNPNLYEDGKVCVSLLGTWSGKGNEMWTTKSTLLQVLLSIQGLILVREPYYNEAGFERQRGTQVGEENSRVYNEMAILKTCQSLTLMSKKPPVTFKDQIQGYLRMHGPRMISRLHRWLEMGLAKRKPIATELVEAGGGSQMDSDDQKPAAADPLQCETAASHEHTSCSDASIGGHENLVNGSNGVEDESVCGTDSMNQDEIQSDNHADSTSKVSQSNGSVTDNVKNVQESNVSFPGNNQMIVTEVSETLQDLSLKPSCESEDSQKLASVEEESPKDNQMCDSAEPAPTTISPPEFPLFPISKGFCITMRSHLRMYQAALDELKGKVD